MTKRKRRKCQTREQRNRNARESRKLNASIKRAEQMLESPGFIPAAYKLIFDVMTRNGMVHVLRFLEDAVERAVLERECDRKMQGLTEIWRTHAKLKKLDALAADSRGNEHERAVAKAKADAMRRSA